MNTDTEQFRVQIAMNGAPVLHRSPTIWFSLQKVIGFSWRTQKKKKIVDTWQFKFEKSRLNVSDRTAKAAQTTIIIQFSNQQT